MNGIPLVEDQEDRHNLYAIWQSTENPKPDWESFKRLVGFSRGDVTRALNLWRRTKDR